MKSVLSLLGMTLLLCAATLACQKKSGTLPPPAKTPILIESEAARKARPTVKASPAAKATPAAVQATPTTPTLKATPAPTPAAAAKTTAPVVQQVNITPTPATIVMPPPRPAPPEPTSPTAKAAPTPAPQPSNPVVVMKTSLGTIEVELDPVRAPITVQNFLYYVQAHHYDGTVFHRVIPTFMIQGGGFTPEMAQKPTTPPIKNEAPNGLLNVRGGIAMARTSALDSATCQFFINVVDNPSLDAMRYAVFGRVTSGMDVVDKIRAVPTHSITLPNGQPFQNVPMQPVIIESVTVKQ